MLYDTRLLYVVEDKLNTEKNLYLRNTFERIRGMCLFFGCVVYVVMAQSTKSLLETFRDLYEPDWAGCKEYGTAINVCVTYAHTYGYYVHAHNTHEHAYTHTHTHTHV